MAHERFSARPTVASGSRGDFNPQCSRAHPLLSGIPTVDSTRSTAHEMRWRRWGYPHPGAGSAFPLPLGSPCRRTPPIEGPPMVKSATPKDIEVEWQFDALDLRPAERWFGALSTERMVETQTLNAPDMVLSAVIMVAKPAERLVDTYFDTADWRIGRSGHVLRVRHRAGRGEVTLKGLAQSEAGLRRRLEVTEPLPADGCRCTRGQRPGGLAPARPGRKAPPAADPRGADPATPLRSPCLGTRPWPRRPSTRPPSWWGAMHQPVRLQRVEVEVVPAWVQAFRRLFVDALRRECGLQPAALSKFEAGLLAAGLRVPPPPELGPRVLRLEPLGRRGGVRRATAKLRRRARPRDRHPTGRGRRGAPRHAGRHPPDPCRAGAVRERAAGAGPPRSDRAGVAGRSTGRGARPRRPARAGGRMDRETSPRKTAPRSPIWPRCSAASATRLGAPC